MKHVALDVECTRTFKKDAGHGHGNEGHKKKHGGHGGGGGGNGIGVGEDDGGDPLPLDAVNWISRRVALWNGTACQLKSGPIIMALGAGKIKLAHSLKVQGLAFPIDGRCIFLTTY